MTTTTTPDARVASATAYVRSRFYPPLPHEYGPLAVEAVDAVNSGEPERLFDVSTLPIQPRGTDDDGQVSAACLVEALRLDHMIETEETLCPDCGGSGSDPEAFGSPYLHDPREAACSTCDGSGVL